jgi:type III restriction enzyme
LVHQAISKLAQEKTENDLKNIVLYHKRDIGTFIYSQLRQHFYVEEGNYEKQTMYPYSKIQPHNFSKYTADHVHLFTETISPINAIPTIVFGGFKKACHLLYKFDSKSEKDFSMILEDDKNVLRWLRPAKSQFQIYWNQNSSQYVPDFVVETEQNIFLIEIKAEKEVDSGEVLEKAQAAKKYCELATRFNLENGGKAWRYMIFPHTAISSNMSFDQLVSSVSK